MGKLKTSASEFDKKLFDLVDIPTDDINPRLKKNLKYSKKLNRKVTKKFI